MDKNVEIERSPILRKTFMEILQNQLNSNEPPETKQTYKRLIQAGIDEEGVRRLIGCVIAGEVYDVLKNKEPFNRSRFVEKLSQLPDTSWLDQ